MVGFSLPRLLAKPLLKPRKLYGIEYNQTLFGVHVPSKKNPETTETWLLTFTKEDDAATFADELLFAKHENGSWPTRILKEQPAVRDSGPFVRSANRTQHIKRHKMEHKALQIKSIEERSLVRHCALTGMLLRVGRKVGSKGYQFERNFRSMFYRASPQEVILHLEDMFEKDLESES